MNKLLNKTKSAKDAATRSDAKRLREIIEKNFPEERAAAKARAAQ